MRFKNLAGRRFGRLVAKAASRKRDSNGNVFWNCVCVCGAKKLVRATSLLSGRTRSCGCLLKERSAERVRKLFFKHGHNMHNSPTYRSWCAAVQRCCNPHNPKFKSYGAVGVTIDPKWRDPKHGFESFLRDMKIRPANTSLGRVLDLGPYRADNCAWQTIAQQNAEKRKKKLIVSEILNQFAHQNQPHTFRDNRKKAA